MTACPGRLNVLKRVFTGRIISTITETEITNYLDYLYEMWSAITSNRTLSIIKQVFQQAVSMKAVSDDPTEKIGYRSEKAHERNRFLLPDELKKLVEASQQTRTKFYMPALIYLGAEHGVSRQEALSLHWTDIKFVGEGIINFFRTKNSNERTEYLMPRSMISLLYHRFNIS